MGATYFTAGDPHSCGRALTPLGLSSTFRVTGFTAGPSVGTHLGVMALSEESIGTIV